MEVSTAVDRSLRISNLFGLSQIHSANRPEIKTWRIVYSTTVACGLIALFLLQCQILDWLSSVRSRTLPQRICHACYSLGHVFGAILAVVNSIRMREPYRKFLTELREMVTFGLGIRIRSYLIGYMLFLIGCIAFNLIELTAKVNWGPGRIAEMTIEFISIVYHMLVSLQFAVLVLALGTKLTEMRNNLEGYLKTLIKNSTARDLKITPENFIQRCRIMYLGLIQQAEILNTIFSTTNLWIIFYMAFIMTYMIYNRMIKIRRLLLEGEPNRTIFILDMIFWAFYGILIISVILSPCDEILKRALELKRTVKHHLIRAKCRELVYELTQFADLLESEKPKFSLYGLLTLRKKIMLTVAGLSVTYVAIISQLPEHIRTR